MNRDRTKKTRETRWPPFLVLVLPATGLLALISLPLLRPDFPDPDDQSLNWRIYQNQPLGFQMEVPQEYHIEEIDDEVRMSFQDTTLVSISLLDFEAAQQRGLWASHHPDGEFVLGGISGHHYSYHHFDLLFGVHARAVVVPYRDRFLALEFRTRRISILEDLGLVARRKDRDLNDRERRMVESLSLVGD